MPDTEQVLLLPVDSIEPDPRNPRVKLRDIERLTESIRARGVLEPIHVRLVESNGSGDRYMVVRGHRRHLGAKAAGYGTIRSIVVDADQAERERLEDQLSENLHRDDLTAAEQAQGVQQLLDLGASAGDVAHALALTTEQVWAASKVAGSKGVAAVTKRHDITMDQAAALAEFEGDKAVFKELTTLAVEHPERFDHRVSQYRQQAADEAAEAAEAARWVAKGYKVLTWLEAQKPPVVPLYALDGEVKLKDHANCEHRAVVVTTNHRGKPEVSAYCTDPAKAGHTLRFKRKGSGALADDPGKTTKQQEAEKLANRTHRACMNASRAAQVVRRQFVRDLLARRTQKGLVPFVVGALAAEHSGMESRHAPMFGELVGIEATASYGSHITVQARYVAKCRGRELLVLLARVAAEREWEWEPNTWERKTPERTAYLRFLLDNGYNPSRVEQVLLGKATGGDVLAAADAAKAAARPQPVKAAGRRKAVKRAPAKRTAKRLPAKSRAVRRA
jgi:ParB family transcriptional regulator, chromosome partitioning protein